MSSSKQMFFIPLSSCLLLFFLSSSSPVSASQHEDVRCKCICPDPAMLLDNKTSPAGNGNTVSSSGRKLYIDNVSPQQCNCDWMVLTQLDPEYQKRSKEFCPRCECKYESRNLTTIKWVVVAVCSVITVLVVYMSVLLFMESGIPAAGRRLYQEQIDEEVSMEDQAATGQAGSSSTRVAPFTDINGGDAVHPPSRQHTNNIVERVNQQQSKWKKQILEQRRNIYDKHTMLN